VTVMTADSQSDSNRAAQVAGDLITNSNIQVMVVASTPDTVNPVANQCDALTTPCLATDEPYQLFLNAQPKEGWKWSWMFCLGVEDFAGNYTTVWNALPTNKKIGVMWPNDADGQGFAQFMPPIIESAGLTTIDAGRWQDGTEDFTREINLFKKEGCEILEGPFITADFTTFWKQCHQQGWVPKIACIDKGLLYPQAIEAVGAPLGYNLTSTMFFAPTWPYKHYLFGDTCQQFADEFTKRTNEQWSSALEHATIFEMAMWALQNARDPSSRESINAAIPSMKFTGLCGVVDFSAPIEKAIPGPRKVHEHVYKEPVMAGQWVQGTHGHPFDYVSVSNVAAPNIPIDAPLLAIPGATSS
jgi:branched-chain amino acid transport system substrate-binding protein